MTILILSRIELGIEASFWDTKAEPAADVLPLVPRGSFWRRDRHMIAGKIVRGAVIGSLVGGICMVVAGCVLSKGKTEPGTETVLAAVMPIVAAGAVVGAIAEATTIIVAALKNRRTDQTS